VAVSDKKEEGFSLDDDGDDDSSLGGEEDDRGESDSAAVL
jgi:hypothetical protein